VAWCVEYDAVLRGAARYGIQGDYWTAARTAIIYCASLSFYDLGLGSVYLLFSLVIIQGASAQVLSESYS
jgi:hypothetical protein